MIDVRDSMFQADPFVMIAKEKSAFYTFKGVEDKTINQCGWNGGWIKDCFGAGVSLHYLACSSNEIIVAFAINTGHINCTTMKH